MKRILMVLALAAAFTAANAQVKTVSAASSALEKAKADTENPKKAGKYATWLKYGQALISAYDAPAGSGWVGATRQDVQMISNNEKPIRTETVVLNGEQWDKDVYETRNYYYNAMGQLGIIEITKPISPTALSDAVAALGKAAELDVKACKSKDIKAALQSLQNKFIERAYNQYTFGDYAKASEDFEGAVNAAATAPLSLLDTNSVYNAGFTAWAGGNTERAKEFFEKCLSAGYYSEDGEVFAKLADIASKEGDADKSRDILEAGFQKFPQSQSILVGLINYYLSNNGSTDRLFELLSLAKENEPNNPSLYYVEGNIRKQLGMMDEAVKAYRACAGIDPKYAYGYIGEGILYYDLALQYQEEAQNEMNDAKYRELDAKFVEALKNCIPAFEKAIDMVDDATKIGVAEYLKNACFRFRTDEEYAQKYEKYSAIVANK